MNSTVEFQSTPVAGTSFGARRALRYALGSATLLGVLVAYCELCSVVRGLPAPGLAISVPWAVQVCLGWIIIGAAVGTFGERVAAARVASTHPRALIFGAILAIALFALVCETVLSQLRGDGPRLLAFIYQRTPVSLAASVILVAIYVGNRVWKQRTVVPSLVELNSPISEPEAVTPAPVQAESRENAADLIDVLTGTGRTRIRMAEIECLQADRNYINVVHASGRTYLLRQTMAAAENTLDPSRFVRIHRSTIVNRHMVKERRRGGILVLQSGRTVSVGRAFRHRL